MIMSGTIGTTFKANKSPINRTYTPCKSCHFKKHLIVSCLFYSCWCRHIIIPQQFWHIIQKFEHELMKSFYRNWCALLQVIKGKTSAIVSLKPQQQQLHWRWITSTCIFPCPPCKHITTSKIFHHFPKKLCQTKPLPEQLLLSIARYICTHVQNVPQRIFGFHFCGASIFLFH